MKLATYGGNEITIIIKLNLFRDEVYLDVLNTDGDTIRFYTDLQYNNLRRDRNGILVTPIYLEGMLSHVYNGYYRKKYTIFPYRFTGDELLRYIRRIKDSI